MPVKNVGATLPPPCPLECGLSTDGLPARASAVALTFGRLLKNPSSLSFRGAAGGEESRKAFVSRARFLASLGMTAFTKVFQHPVSLLNLMCGEPTHIVCSRQWAGKESDRSLNGLNRQPPAALPSDSQSGRPPCATSCWQCLTTRSDEVSSLKRSSNRILSAWRRRLR